jgi:hypothetical protein
MRWNFLVGAGGAIADSSRRAVAGAGRVPRSR